MKFGTLPLGLDFVAAMFGLEKNHRELIIIKDSRVTKANNYMLKQYKRLEKHAKEGNQEAYASLSRTLLQDSKVYQYIAMHRVSSGWFWELKACRIKATMRKLSKICKNLVSTINYHRSWIPKGEDKYGRPLGVPTLEWRMWSWMNLNILEIWHHYQGLKPTWQHGGVSGKGTMTAWKAILNGELEKSNILEFDIKGFFTQLSHESIINWVSKSKMEFMKDWVKGTLESSPRKQNFPPLNEERPEFISQSEIDEKVMFEELFEEAYRKMGYTKEQQEAHMKPYLEAEAKRDLMRIKAESVGYQRNLHFGLDLEGKGTPQGLGTSPFLSVMTIGDKLKEIPGLTMYMDDGIITAETYEELMNRFRMLKEGLESAGLKIAEEKTHIVRKEGQWERSLKFLGMRYIPETDIIQGETKAGKIEEFPRAEWRELLLEGKIYQTGNSDNMRTMRNVLSMTAQKAAIRYGLLGLFMSKVYSPNLEVTERELIEIGINKVLNGMRSSKNTFMEDNRESWFIIEDSKELLFTGSTRMIKLVLEGGFLKRKTVHASRGRPRKNVVEV